MKELRLLIGTKHQKRKTIRDAVYNWMSEYIMGQLLWEQVYWGEHG